MDYNLKQNFVGCRAWSSLIINAVKSRSGEMRANVSHSNLSLPRRQLLQCKQSPGRQGEGCSEPVNLL